jgi:hypothetical protein
MTEQITADVGGVGSNTCLGADENEPFLKMAERQDWALFRTVEGLQQKAGVPAVSLRRLVLKELADNALDTGAEVRVGLVNPEKSLDPFFVEDNGPGLDGTPEDIASLFSIQRPMRSSKLLRLPQRGALGNGLRVVAGAVLASEGSLAVITRNQRIELRPQPDGSTTVLRTIAAEKPQGTRIEIGFGPALPNDGNVLLWVHGAVEISNRGKSYEGRSSTYWYDLAQFHELLLAQGSQPLRGLIAQLDGCTGAKAGDIVAAAGLDRMSCNSISRAQAKTLLEIAREHARPVTSERLGCVGRDAYPQLQYAIERGHIRLGSTELRADLPFVVEAWAQKSSHKEGKSRIRVLVNRTPIPSDIALFRGSDKEICITGCGLCHSISGSPTKGAYEVVLNLITPFCPIVSDGKNPDLEPFVDEICSAILAAAKKAQRAAPKDKRLSQKEVILDNLEDAIASASGDGEYRFNERQIFYQLRPIVLEETGQPLLIGNFKGVLTDYENEHGEIVGMYREPRGSIYHPHRNEEIPLGTLAVEDYERPAWTYNKLVYIEKEGFSEALKAAGWPERHDCALMSSKGFSTRAARDLIDKVAAYDEPCTIFCVHDADAYGTMIFQTLQNETKARGARKVRVVNLGLEPWEAVDDGLEIENVDKGDKHKPVADYVLEQEDGDYWDEWLQTHRVELNAMTTPQFIDWLSHKMEVQGGDKLVPPATVMKAELEEHLEQIVRTMVTERILREAGLENQIRGALNKIKRPNDANLVKGVKKMFSRSPQQSWRAHVEAVGTKLLAATDKKIAASERKRAAAAE